MNIFSYQKPATILTTLKSSNQDPVYGINFRGYLTRATFIAVGIGGIVLLSRKIDLSENFKHCFYALRKYFPRGKDKDERSSPTSGNNNEICPICLGTPKTGVRAPCGHLICANCLTRYCEVRNTTEPPCPLCRAPVKSITLATDVSEDLKAVVPTLSDSTITEMNTERPSQNVKNRNQETIYDKKKIHYSSTLAYFNIWYDQSDYLTRNITWIFLTILLFSLKFQVLSSYEFSNGYENIINLIISGIAFYTFCIMYLMFDGFKSLTTLKP